MNIRWREVVFPGLALFEGIAYWYQLREAASAAKRVPNGVMVLLLILIAIVVWREALAHREAEEDQSTLPRPTSIRNRIGAWFVAYRRECIFVLLSFGYYIAFQEIGFNLANALFLFLAFILMKMKWKSNFIYTTATVLLLFATPEVMNFNVPVAPWFR